MAGYSYEVAGDSAGHFYRPLYNGRPFYIHGIDGLSRATAERLAKAHVASRESLHALTGAPVHELRAMGTPTPI
jgi:hypothetical protein